jgi:hypothetical protein
MCKEANLFIQERESSLWFSSCESAYYQRQSNSILCLYASSLDYILAAQTPRILILGSIRGPDGSIRGPDGSIRGLDGSIHPEDGSIRRPDGSIRPLPF